MRRVRVTPSMVVAMLALVVAVSGTAAAASYIITKTSQIKPSVRRALKGNRGPRGPQGAQGAQGVQGPQGAPATPVTYKSVFVPGSVPQGTIVTIDATCPPGFVVTGGGEGVGANDLVYADSADDHTYEVAVGNYSSLSSASASAQAFCASGLGAAARAATRTLSPSQRAALIADYSARHGR